MIRAPGLVALELDELPRGVTIHAPPRRTLAVERRSAGAKFTIGRSHWPKPAAKRPLSWAQREARIKLLEAGVTSLEP